MNKLRLLLLENLGSDSAFLEKALQGKGFDVIPEIVNDDSDLLEAIATQDVHAILAGSRASKLDPQHVLTVLKERNISIPLIILVGSQQEARIGLLMHDGAASAIPVGDLERLPDALRDTVADFKIAAKSPAAEVGADKRTALLYEAAELAHFGCWESNMADHTEQWNDELYRILGLLPGEVKPSLENILRRVHPEDVMHVTQVISDAVRTKKTQKIDCRVLCNDAVKFIVVEMAVIRDAAGQAIRLYGYVHDVTETRSAELKEKKVIADLLQRNKDLEQFAYIISHNLRAPVANIVGVTTAILEDNLNVEEVKEFIGALSVSVGKLDSIITDLNHILQVKKHVNENMEMVNFAQLVEEVKSNIGVFIPDECVMIMTDFKEAEQMPSLKSYMRSIFYNLISNSIKYRKPDMAPVIEITSRKYNTGIELTFKDNSIGIDMDKKGDQVFGLYKRFNPAHAEGKGMGLYMVKTQVETLGGTISVHSAINKGAEFRITFEMQN